MRDLCDCRLICIKGGLFVVAGSLSVAALLLEHPDLRTALLIGLAVWCFARAYYFAFYVLEAYVNPRFRYRGLWSLLRYLASRRSSGGLAESG